MAFGNIGEIEHAIAAKALKPSIEIVGVEAALFPSFRNAIHGTAMPLGGPTLAEWRCTGMP